MRLILLLVSLAMTAIASAALAGDTTETDIRVSQVTDDIHLFSCCYGRHYVNVTAFSGPDGLLLVDSGHERTVRALTGMLKDSNLGIATYIINTHLHRDHTGGNGALGSDATIIAHENVKGRLLEKVDDSLKSGLIGLPNATVTDSLILHFNGDTVRVIHLPNGHTDGDVIVHLVRAKVVCMGDLLFSDAIPHVFKYLGGSIDGYIDNLGVVLSTFPEDVTLIPGHGRVYTMEELREYRDMLSGITERVRTEFRDGKEMDEVFGSGVLQEWEGGVSQEYVNDSAFILMVWDNDRHK